jgi:hypothetical protein
MLFLIMYLLMVLCTYNLQCKVSWQNLKSACTYVKGRKTGEYKHGVHSVRAAL